MDREHYKTMAKTLLLDEKYYQELSADPQKSDKIKYKSLLSKYKDCLTEKEIDYLVNFEMKPSNFMACQKFIKVKKLQLHVNKTFILCRSL